GAILDETTILTAAHCLFWEIPSHLSVSVGSLLTTSNQNIYNVTSYTTYPTQPGTSPADYDDIAVLKLASSITFTDNIKPIQLPTQDENQPAEHTVCQISGWGYTDTNEDRAVRLLKFLVRVQTNEECRDKWFLNPNSNLTLDIKDTHLCAGVSPVDAHADPCLGYSGGPLTCIRSRNDGSTDDSVRVLYGIISIGDDPCGRENGRPGIYTRVSKYVNWIKQQMNS
ncbi:kallikrein-13-like, partial [Tubulanus polymorphus]|uniref:kallikrein-13-like n=1 Tax=Tubulanus polymorphus TaxID=672921 RepID=UPI003DA4E27C